MQQPSVSLSHDTASFGWRPRLQAATIHLALSALVAMLAGVLVFMFWFPYPYREISGGRELFQLVVSVDVVLGPLITFAVYNLAKPRAELRRDLALVALLQLAGLGYGLWTVHLARPVHMVFELDRFRVVHQVEIPLELAAKAPSDIEIAPLLGPTLISLRPFRDPQENMEMTMAALGGVSLSARPELWQSYEAGRPQVLKAAKPVGELISRFPQRQADIEATLRKAGGDATHASYLPLVARKAEAWTVLLDAGNAQVLGYLPLDSF
jgi:hypothetical protein